MDSTIRFGTDGWRAVIADQFTFDNVRACAYGVARYLRQTGQHNTRIVIGNDTRFASDEFAAACAEVMAGNGIRVLLCSKPTPTPVISYSVSHTNSAGAIIITASHNPGNWNGFKYKDENGASAPGETISQIERFTNESLTTGKIERIPLKDALKTGIVTMHDPFPAYSTHIRKMIDIERIRLSPLKIVVDSMYGAGTGCFRHFLEGSNVKMTEINDERNPFFPNIQPEPIARNLIRLCSLIRETSADVGLATDGDSDRIGIVNEKGIFLNQLEVFSLLALYFIEIRGEKHPIVRTLTSSNMLDILGKKYGLPVYITRVGFKYVAPVMLEKDAFIGGEESGGYGFRGHVPERDGILAGLYFLDYMTRTGKTPSQLLKHLFDIVGPHYYDRYDFHMTIEQHQKILQHMENQSISSIAGAKVSRLDMTDGYKYILEDDSWLLIRFSGTEPLVRIYAETTHASKVKEMLEAGKEIVGV